uniref:Retrotransposon gag domain-containing protein n=1 Tax=Hyaloperonospora arabidopsidis (strain Emoy2) TaxID=559515 RepID=M4BDT6_HYAAE
MAQGLGDPALANFLSCPPEQHVPQMEQFEKFVLGHRMSASEARSHEVVESISNTHDELLHEQARNEALNRTAETLSARSIQLRPIGMETPKFDGTAARTIVLWLLAIKQCGVAQLIEDDTRVVSCAMFHFRGKASEWAYSALMADIKAFRSWVIFKTRICAMYHPPDNEVFFAPDKLGDFYKTMCRKCARCRHLLVWVRYRNTLRCPRSLMDCDMAQHVRFFSERCRR